MNWIFHAANTPRWLAIALFSATCWLLAPPAAATEAELSSEPAAIEAEAELEPIVEGFAALDGPVGIAEGGVGVLTLPAAEVCAERRAGCKQGDLSFALEAWQLYRANLRLAFGAGLVLGLIPTARPPQDDPERDQTRSYLMVEGALRGYPYVANGFELWLGLTGGLVVVNDRFQLIVNDDDRAMLGPRGATIRTEGATLGAASGFAYWLTDAWSFTGAIRYAFWLLPDEPARDPGGRQASLTGENSVVTLAFGMAYRVSL